MGFAELFLIGVGLSMDAFAVSVCKGLNMREKINYKHAFIIALFFGGFQALMPAIGYFLGRNFEKYITAFDHWIAFGLLAFIGIKMMIDAVKEWNCEDKAEDNDRLDIKELFMLAVATSIDALAVGITFAFLQVSIGAAVSIIGVTTFVLSIIGVVIGNKFGSRYKSKAELAGGIILVLIGLKILLEHLGIINF
ncbi:MAG: manganese efflux pump MntP family protein [Oscillospiraceae bacterium]|nr:manganese efflux pump MntP family protein [Oscillospiraceae bacterium]